ncbi:MAG: hypothetical protein MOB07_31605 [Acidobacteria bacterium]|nr:hypothetical protein [Acidobacteriota bacterium]
MSTEKPVKPTPGLMGSETGVKDKDGQMLHYGDTVEFLDRDPPIFPHGARKDPTLRRGVIVPIPQIRWIENERPGRHSELTQCDQITRIVTEENQGG